jgi:hypothetical protein
MDDVGLLRCHQNLRGATLRMRGGSNQKINVVAQGIEKFQQFF